MQESILILDFGGQYNQLIARRVRECNVYCEVKSYKTSIDEIKKFDPTGIIFTGGPNSVYLENSPKCDKELFELGIPVLGICYGMQLMASVLGGKVTTPVTREYGKTDVTFKGGMLFDGVPDQNVCWMSHTDYVEILPQGFIGNGYTDACPNAAMENAEKKLYGVQFHPEVMHTQNGTRILKNFLYNVCGCHGLWTMKKYAADIVAQLKKQIGNKKVLCALSGGVDSSVAATLVHAAIGKNLTCIFVDTGLMRKNEGDEVEKAFAERDLTFIRVNAGERFLSKLAGVSEPEAKRKIIGEEFIRVFEDESNKIGDVELLVQGTIYPDVIESGSGDASTIKSHHNVGGLPKDTKFTGIIEPLRLLFKDEVRQLGIELGLPEKFVWRQPFPGPGLGIRIIGEITEEKVSILQDADAIFREEVMNYGLMRDVNQYFAVLTSMKSVGVMGDGRTYDYTLALRAVTTTDFMTADWARLPYDLLEKVSNRIVNEVKMINRIVYDITSKPPATIEWE